MLRNLILECFFEKKLRKRLNLEGMTIRIKVLFKG